MYYRGMTSTTVNVNHQGRVSIPAPMRHELGITPNTPLVTYIEEGRVVLETREHLVRRIQRKALGALSGSGSVVNELIAERRAEAASEQSQTEA